MAGKSEKKTPKKKNGRPSKFSKIDLKQVERLGGLGMIDMEIAYILGVSEKTLNTYKKKHSKFLQSLKKGKAAADIKVLESLYDRATGHHIEESVMIDGKKETIKKYFPADTTAMIFWIKNRRADFRDTKDRSSHTDLSELAAIMKSRDLKT